MGPPGKSHIPFLNQLLPRDKTVVTGLGQLGGPERRQNLGTQAGLCPQEESGRGRVAEGNCCQDPTTGITRRRSTLLMTRPFHKHFLK